MQTSDIQFVAAKPANLPDDFRGSVEVHFDGGRARQPEDRAIYLGERVARAPAVMQMEEY